MNDGEPSQNPRTVGTIAVGTALLVALMHAPGPANATYPGRNGRIAFTRTTNTHYLFESEKSTLVTITPSGKRWREITAPAVVSDLAAAFSPRGGWIVYGQQGGLLAPPGGLVLLRANGRGDEKRLTEARRLYPPYTEDLWPAFAPDGRRIAFTQRYYDPPGSPDRLDVRIYRRGRSRLLLTDAFNPSWSVRNRIAFARGRHGRYGIWTIRPDGTGLHKILDRAREPDWSPDGRRLVFVRGSSIATAQADGRRVRRLHRGINPVFSPDGRSIAFISDPSRAGDPCTTGDLCTMSVRGRHVRRLVSARDEDAFLHDPAWQPRPRR